MLRDIFSFLLIIRTEFSRPVSAIIAYSDRFSNFTVSFIVPQVIECGYLF